MSTYIYTISQKHSCWTLFQLIEACWTLFQFVALLRLYTIWRVKVIFLYISVVDNIAFFLHFKLLAKSYKISLTQLSIAQLLQRILTSLSTMISLYWYNDQRPHRYYRIVIEINFIVSWYTVPYRIVCTASYRSPLYDKYWHIACTVS